MKESNYFDNNNILLLDKIFIIEITSIKQNK